MLVDRLWPRSIRKEDTRLTLWLKDIAPGTELRRWSGHDPARWNEFSRRCRAELDANGLAVDRLRAFLVDGPLTLLCAAHDTTHNHAVVPALYLHAHAEGAP